MLPFDQLANKMGLMGALSFVQPLNCTSLGSWTSSTGDGSITSVSSIILSQPPAWTWIGGTPQLAIAVFQAE